MVVKKYRLQTAAEQLVDFVNAVVAVNRIIIVAIPEQPYNLYVNRLAAVIDLHPVVKVIIRQVNCPHQIYIKKLAMQHQQ